MQILSACLCSLTDQWVFNLPCIYQKNQNLLEIHTSTINDSGISEKLFNSFIEDKHYLAAVEQNRAHNN